MSYFPFPLTPHQSYLVEAALELAATFSRRAAEHDRTGSFPHANFAELRAAGVPAWVVPTEYGGQGATLLDTVLVCDALGSGDGSTALAVTMHLQTLGNAAESRAWPETLFADLCRAAVEQGALLNYIASEPELGSPSRGGKPATTARPVPAYNGRPPGYLLNGRKNFASMSPTLDYLITSASLEDGTDRVANFVLTPGPGMQIEETWDALGMRTTGSHDVILSDVFVPAERMIPPGLPAPNTKPNTKPKVNPWFSLCVSAVYVGVAAAALATAAAYAHTRVPTALGKSIAELESIQRRLGEATLQLHQARALLYHTAAQWVAHPQARERMSDTILVAKYTATNNAIAVVDHAMRAVGGPSMSKALPLERYYRDVRGGLMHPMHDDMIFLTLGRQSLAHHTPQPQP